MKRYACQSTVFPTCPDIPVGPPPCTAAGRVRAGVRWADDYGQPLAEDCNSDGTHPAAIAGVDERSLDCTPPVLSAAQLERIAANRAAAARRRADRAAARAATSARTAFAGALAAQGFSGQLHRLLTATTA